MLVSDWRIKGWDDLGFQAVVGVQGVFIKLNGRESMEGILANLKAE